MDIKKFTLTILTVLFIVFMIGNFSTVKALEYIEYGINALPNGHTDAFYFGEQIELPNYLSMNITAVNVSTNTASNVYIVRNDSGSGAGSHTFIQNASIDANYIATFTPPVTLSSGESYCILVGNENEGSYDGYLNSTYKASNYPKGFTNFTGIQWLSTCTYNTGVNEIYGFFDTSWRDIYDIYYTLEYGINPFVTPTAPQNASYISTNSIILNDTVLPINSTLTNATFFVWYENSSIVNETTISLAGNVVREASANITGIPFGNRLFWNTYVCANDDGGNAQCNFAINNLTFTAYNVSESFEPEIIEGASTDLGMNVTFTGIDTDLQAILIWNNTYYTPSKNVVGSDIVAFTSTFTVPTGSGTITGNNISHFWRFWLPNNILNSTTTPENQTVYSVGIDDCSVYSDVLANFTLYDENTLEFMNATSENPVIETDLTLYNQDRTSILAQYHNIFSANNATVCVNSGILGSTSLSLDGVTSYKGDSYVTEFHYMDNETINSTTTPLEIALRDLPLDDSTTFLFSFLGEDNLEIPNAIVHVFRQYIGDGDFLEVERGKQDSNGETHLHLVEEDVIYYFEVTVGGILIYTSDTYNAKCLSTPCSIELEASPEFTEFPTNWYIMDGGRYLVSSNPITRTVYLSFLSDDSLTINLTVAKQDYQGDISVVGSSQVTANSGNISVVVPASAGNVTYYAIVYKNGEYIAHSLVDFTHFVTNYGTTGNFMGFILVIGLILMGASEGILLFVFFIFALIIASALALFKFSYYAVIGFICAMAILLYKLIKRGRTYR